MKYNYVHVVFHFAVPQCSGLCSVIKSHKKKPTKFQGKFWGNFFVNHFIFYIFISKHTLVKAQNAPIQRQCVSLTFTFDINTIVYLSPLFECSTTFIASILDRFNWICNSNQSLKVSVLTYQCIFHTVSSKYNVHVK